MRYCLLILLLFMPLSVFAQGLPAEQETIQDKGVLVRSIDIDGFVLGDKGQFIKLFKPYRNKYLTGADMDAILLQIQIIYEREGYKELVSISYKVTKHHLEFTVLMTS